MIKLGGSLIHDKYGENLRKIGNIIHQFSDKHPSLIVPGGGPFADTVRNYGQQLKLSEETCHFMALSAMEQYAFLLKEFIPNSTLTDLSNTESPIKISHPAKPQILLCSRFLSKITSTVLPRSWAVTSDSIAAYLAKRLNIPLLVILKSTDISSSLKEPDVDNFFQQLLPIETNVWFINGSYPERLYQLLQSGVTTGINIPANSLVANTLNRDS